MVENGYDDKKFARLKETVHRPGAENRKQSLPDNHKEYIRSYPSSKLLNYLNDSIILNVTKNKIDGKG